MRRDATERKSEEVRLPISARGLWKRSKLIASRSFLFMRQASHCFSTRTDL